MTSKESIHTTRVAHGAAGAANATDPSSTFAREDVDAALRTGYVSHVDPRGLAVATETAARLVTEFGTKVHAWKTFRDELTIVVAPTAIVEVLTWLRDSAGWALLSDISPCDWLDSEGNGGHPKRFAVNYEMTKIADGAPRLRIQVWLDEGETVESVLKVYPTADWHEREAFDFFGIVFTGREGLRRLIMADDWEGHPLRKDYPLGGEPVKFTNSLREI